MITVLELKKACERIEREFGSHCSVCMQIYGDDGSLISEDYCIDIFRNGNGTIFLTNHKFKHGMCE